MEVSFGDKVLEFYDTLSPPLNLKTGIEWINSFDQEETKECMIPFFKKYYSDVNPRVFWFGINPGRFGSGLTGVGFTDPINLETVCGIGHSFPNKHELSSQFVYAVLEEYGNMDLFYKHHFLTCVCPYGLTRNGKNFNYYDDVETLQQLSGFLIDTLHQQYNFGAVPTIAICIGRGKNFDLLKKWNDEQGWFETIVPLPHPRWVMQYKRSQLNHYIDVYLNCIEELTQYVSK